VEFQYEVIKRSVPEATIRLRRTVEHAVPLKRSLKRAYPTVI